MNKKNPEFKALEYHPDLINKIFSDLQVHPMEQLQEIFFLSIGIF